MKSIIDCVQTVKRPEKVLQYGEGNFLRAFVDWQIDIANEKTDFNGNVVIVQPIGQGLSEVIQAQKGLYTTILRGVKANTTQEELRAITSISRCLNPFVQFDEYIKCAENPDLRFVVSNTTEAGIAYNADDRLADKPQKSFPAKVTAFLYRRFEYFQGDPSKALIFIPCELIDKNGTKLKALVEQYAAEWRLGDTFRTWLDSCDFCNSLVDRIVTGYPRQEEIPTLWEKIGYKDQLLDTAELFHLWVIETKRDHTEAFPLTKAGLNVIWTDDMSFYRTRKVRILNGAHTATVPAAFQYGLNTVEDCIYDPLVSAFMKKCIFEEIIPSMDGSQTELIQYADAVLERFANPYIKHQLLSITLNSVSKFKTRILPSLIGFVRKNKKLPVALCFSCAALIAFYRGKDFENSALTGMRGAESYPIKDDEDILKTFAALYETSSGTEQDARRIVHRVLSLTGWWGEDLTVYADLEETVAQFLGALWRDGFSKVLSTIVGQS
ncbi:MAG: tagaturonate reductase [Spirochaetaceae bacterium]|nr:tagaturonate reductase [Spirochaetaceae bacterium]